MNYDVIIVGGGPAGLSAALNLGRARRRVLLCDAGPRRNAAAVHIHGFVTRDGTTPDDFRRIAREQLAAYRSVEVRDAGVAEISGTRGSFNVRLQDGETVTASRILLSTGMVDEIPQIEGFRELWGKSIFICPYCHAWEVQDRRFAFLAPAANAVDFALLLRNWTNDVVVLTNGEFEATSETFRVDNRRIARLVADSGKLSRIEFEEGGPLAVDVLFARPPQRQVAIVRSLGLELDGQGYVRIDEQRQTSIKGIYAGGDLISPAQSAIMAAAAGSAAAGALNHDLSAEQFAAAPRAMQPA